MLHARGGLGAATETFIVDRMLELERLGWEAWVAAMWEDSSGLEGFPPPERVFMARRRDRWSARAAFLAGRRRSREIGSWWLEPAIAAASPELIHAHFGWTGTWALPAARRHSLPLVVGFHGYDVLVYPRYGFDGSANRPKRVHSDGVYEELFAEAARILVTSRFLAARLRDLGCDRAIDVIPSGIHLERFPFRGPREDPSEYRLAFVGRLIPYKGIDVALRAVDAVRKAIPGVSLDVIGDGPERARAEALAAERSLAVRFHGFRKHNEVANLLARSDVLVFPSRTTATGQAEALGNVVKEALAVGLPVAASNSGGISETIPPELRAELVPENDAAALAARLIALWEGRDRWGERTALGRRWVERMFDWRQLGPRIADAYEGAVGAV